MFVGLAEKAKAMHGRSEKDPKEGLFNILSSRCIIVRTECNNCVTCLNCTRSLIQALKPRYNSTKIQYKR